jgi:ribonuclease Z
MVVLVPSIDLNPEPYYYYQKRSDDYISYREIEDDDSLTHKQTCEPMPHEDMDNRIKQFVPKSDKGKELYKMLKEECGVDKVIAVEVDHCPQSYACLIDSAHGKLVYSGDTLPCQNLINYATNARVLIHEATFGEGLEADALMKKHTTTS